MEFFNTVEARHCYRGKFLDEKISRKELEKIVTAGVLAPSGKNEQTTEFVIVDDAELLAQIRELHNMPAVQTASAMIVCLIDKQPQPVYEGKSFQIEDCAVATENMLLAIAAMGYASVWIDGALRIEGRSDKICKIISAPLTKAVRILLPIGKPEKATSQPPKKAFNQRAYFNKYGK